MIPFLHFDALILLIFSAARVPGLTQLPISIIYKDNKYEYSIISNEIENLRTISFTLTKKQG